ncbi:MAG: response regulator transcription factor [Gemmatimonadetes bacterium]|nr:response regulator transcription factor [Gemmatimonadota bacterium]
MKPIRVLIADDHTLVRSGLCALLGRLEDVDVVAEAADGREAIEKTASHSPNVVLMDITMPELNGLDATARITRQFPGVRILIVSMHAREEYVEAAFRSGASGYLLKDAGIAELARALRAVAGGGTYVRPAADRRTRLRRAKRSLPGGKPCALPTPRQREILQLVAEGHTSGGIAARLRISEKTVEAHRTQMMKRLGIENLAGLVRYAIWLGLTSPGR